MQHIRNLRLRSQQLLNPHFSSPQDLISFMGAMQAQDYQMAKWAIALRLKKQFSNNEVEQALNEGKILRTHILRPTWHFIHPEDIRWMLQLTGKRIKAANNSLGKSLNIDEKLDSKVNKLLEKNLSGNVALTKQEITEIFEHEKIPATTPHLNRFLLNAEADGIICSGPIKANKHSYMLLEERVPSVKEIHKDEALAKMAKAYFRSHSPATLNDFVWWSGLTINEARQAINFIEEDLIKDTFEKDAIYIHKSLNETIVYNSVHLLPSYDEYLISYKSRTVALEPQHFSKAFTNYGIFYPVILHQGEVIGNWKKLKSKNKTICDFSFFHPGKEIDKKLLEEANIRYQSFIQ